MNLIRKLSIIFIFIGVIGMGINTIFGVGSVGYISPYYDSATGITYYKYNFHLYLTNLATSINQVPNISLEIPETHFDEVVRALKSIGNWIIFIANILLLPLRIGGYIGVQIWTLLGMKPDIDNTTWIMRLCIWLRDAYIPYFTFII